MELPQDGAPDPRHPIVAAALARHGLTPEDVLRHPHWEDGLTQRYDKGGDDVPTVNCTRAIIRVHLACRSPRIVFYINEDPMGARQGACVAQLEFREWMPPECVLAALPGRPLETLADIPGGTGLLIARAEEMVTGLVVTLEPAELSSGISAPSGSRASTG